MRLKPFRVNKKWILLFSVTMCFFGYFGLFTHLFERDYKSSFSYPYEGDIRRFVDQLKNNETPDVKPINVYNYSFISACTKKCSTPDKEVLRIVYIVKSALPNFHRRKAIRETWGFEKRFSDVQIRTVFVLGVTADDRKLLQEVQKESARHGDIVQANFIDDYFNNTIKTMMGISWAFTYCPNAQFYFFSDDDMYVSTKNVLRFIRNPAHYPEYLETPVISLRRREKRNVIEGRTSHDMQYNTSGQMMRRLHQFQDFELADDVVLFAGYVFVSSPQRHFSSKWYVPLSEYPYNMWPPYVTAGAYILSRNALIDMYYASLYTKHFRFDDIYLGILAKKLGIEPFHCSEFHFYKMNYNVYSYHYVIASHGYSDPDEIIRVWNEQRSVGNA
ncbi:beta-1,3-galactosyltransferase brn [Schistocerca nitens]|uniref:beta-1,3-galactosyltransferase brn n=1 Tax=Schistocerca nitens TaxID=7011 RepID=UPI0021178FEB|nr:beta-1,3-galactosyltransferase brn [Schistocerca nitens]